MHYLFRSLLLLPVLLSYSSGAFTSAGGRLSTSTQWDSDTVNVTDTITVDDGVTLSIHAGVTIIFQGHYPVYVAGRILAEGSEEDSIRFMPVDTAVGWFGIRFNNTSVSNDSSLFNYCIITGGKAPGSSDTGCGGGVYLNTASKVRFSHCSFKNNSAGTGGAIYLLNSDPVITNTIVMKNSAATYGGGIRCTNSKPFIVNCAIVENRGYTAGGIDCVNSIPTVVNTHIVRNVALEGAGIRCYTSSPNLVNTIIWSNDIHLGDRSSDPDFSCCAIEGGVAGFKGVGAGDQYEGTYTQCIDSYPVFVDTAGSNYQLMETSPCINKGREDLASLSVPSTDLAGNQRIANAIIDIGAYENQNSAGVIGQIRSGTLLSGFAHRGREQVYMVDVRGCLLGKIVSGSPDYSRFQPKCPFSGVVVAGSDRVGSKMLLLR